MARPSWSGTIQISLIGFAVEIYPATSSSRPISFHEIDRKTMGRVHHQNVVEAPTRPEEPAVSEDEDEAEDASAEHETSLHLASKAGHGVRRRAAETETPDDEPAPKPVVDRSDIVKGYEYEKGKYAIVEPAELKNLRLAGKKTVEISQFAKSTEINPALYDKPYFVLPKPGPQATAFAVIRESMMDSGVVGIGEIVLSGRQHLMALAPPQDRQQPGMMLYTLRFGSALRDARDYSKDMEKVTVDDAQRKLAGQLIEAYTQPFELEKFKDHYEDALRELVEAKINHLPLPSAEPERKTAKVINLMDALRRSLAQKSGSKAADDQPSTPQEAAKKQAKKPPAETAKAKSSAARPASKRPRSA